MDNTSSEAVDITINVKSMDGRTMAYRVRPNSSLNTVTSSWAEATGAHMRDLRFTYHGDAIKAQTPAELGMHDGDELDVHPEWH